MPAETKPAATPLALTTPQPNTTPESAQVQTPAPKPAAPAASVTNITPTPATALADTTQTPGVSPRPLDAIGTSLPTGPAGDSSTIQKFHRPDTIAPAIVSTPSNTPTSTAGELPNYVATQIESLKKLIPSQSSPAAAVQSGFKQSLSSPPKAQSIMAATVAIVLMGGYIWLNNFNNLSVKSASQKAGIQASFPGYVPNSFSLNGPVAYGPGFVSIAFKSPNATSPLTITQQKTGWDSAALLQQFVNTKSKSYVSVANQGLTIYLYNNNQATWVNKGLQYVISGDTRLSRDQVLKIATSL